MSRPKGGTNRYYTKEEKLVLVKRMLKGETRVSVEKDTGINRSLLDKWKRQYLAGGEKTLENKRKPGNPLLKYTRRKELSPIEQLEYENLLLKRELMKEKAKYESLKKAIKS